MKKAEGWLKWFLKGLLRWPISHLKLEFWILWQSFCIFAARLRGKAIVLDSDYYRITTEGFLGALRVNREVIEKVYLTQIPLDLCRASLYGYFIRRRLDLLDRQALLEMKWDGLDLAEMYRTRFCGDAYNLDYSDSPVISRDYVYHHFLDAIVLYEVHKRLVRRFRPSAMLIFQGAYGLNRVLNEFRHRFNVRTVAMETSFLGDRLYFDGHSGMILNRFSLAKHGREFRARNDEDLDAASKAHRIWKDSLSHKIQDHQTSGIESADQFQKRYGFDLNQPFALILGQVQVDASVMLDSPLYANSVDFLEAAVKECVELGIPVVVRFHPREAKIELDRGVLPNTSYHQLLSRFGGIVPPNVTLVPGTEVDTFMLIGQARMGITLNSQSGLEMSLHGKPVVTAATCMYAHKGFTWDVAHPCALAASIQAAWNHAADLAIDPGIQQGAGQFILDMTRICMPLRSVDGSVDLILRQLGSRCATRRV